MPKGSEIVTVVRKPRADRLKPTPAAEQRFAIEDCFLVPRASQEEGGGWVQIDGFTVIAPGEVDIKAEDQVEARGGLYSVIGTPGVFRKKRKAYTLATLTRVV